MLDIIEDFEISRIVKARENDPEIEVNIYDL